MIFRNTLLIYLLQRVCENNYSDLEHLLASHMSTCLNEIVNLGKYVALFRPVEKECHELLGDHFIFISQNGSTSAGFCFSVLFCTCGCNSSKPFKPVVIVCLLTALASWTLSAFSWTVDAKARQWWLVVSLDFFSVWHNSVEVSNGDKTWYYWP